MKVYRLLQQKGGIDAGSEVVIVMTAPGQVRVQRYAEYKAGSDGFKAFVQNDERDAFLQELREEDDPSDHVNNALDAVVGIAEERAKDDDESDVDAKQGCSQAEILWFDILGVYTLDCVVMPNGWPGEDSDVISPDDLAANMYKAVDEMNLCFQNSRINVRGRLQKIEGTYSYMDDGQPVPADTNAHRVELLRGRAGQFKRVFDLRDENECRIIFFVTGKIIAGPAQSGNKPAAHKDHAFILMQFDKVLEEYTPAHEFGHLFGAGHDAGGSGLHPQAKKGEYAHGHVTQEWRTVMSYLQQKNGKPFGAEVIPYFSDPDILYNGAPTGTANANNAKVIRDCARTLYDVTRPP